MIYLMLVCSSQKEVDYVLLYNLQMQLSQESYNYYMESNRKIRSKFSLLR